MIMKMKSRGQGPRASEKKKKKGMPCPQQEIIVQA
jgi:hypothetical protein